jgi:hypothetical protein
MEWKQRVILYGKEHLAAYFSTRSCNLDSHDAVKSDVCRFVLQQHETGVHRCEGLPVTSVRHSIDKCECVRKVTRPK